MSAERSERPPINLFDAEFVANPQPFYARMRSECPVARSVMGGFVITRYEDVLYALRHPEVFSSGMDAVALGNVRPLIPLQIDPPQQTKYRKIMDPLFARRRVLALEPDVRKLANDLIDRFADRGECEFDRDFAIPFPCTVFLRLMGLPLEDLEAFLAMKDGIIRPEATDPEEAARMRSETGARIYAYFEAALDERTSRPRDDVLSQLLSAEVEGERLTREEILDTCFLFLLGGLDTVTASLGCGVAYLAQHPEKRRAIVEDPSLVPSAVEELLRWETPVLAVPRVVKREVTLGDVTLAAGEHVTLLLGSADTDEEQFAGADRVELERERNRHLAFGGGPHRCLGSHLARMELTIAFEELHRRIPEYAIQAGETLRYGLGIREVQYLPLVFEAAR
jgi:cytochrome P450